MDALELSHKVSGADTEDDFKNGAPVADQNIVWVRGAPAYVGLIDVIGPNGGKGKLLDPPLSTRGPTNLPIRESAEQRPVLLV